MVASPIITLAGANGDLGGRIAKALISRGANVRALVRPGMDADEGRQLQVVGAQLREPDPADRAAMAEACKGAACVVSALNGLRPVMIDRQTVLLDAAVQAGVPRFISSDYSADFTKTVPGQNRNFDLRRKFMARADGAPIKVTSIFNGAFLDMLGAEMPLIQPSIRRVLYWHDADQPLDFTTRNDTAAFTAAAALDADTPRVLRIAGDTVSVRDIAAIMSEVSGRRFQPLGLGGLGMLGAMIALTKRLVPQPDKPFPPWQGMQYMRDMFSGRAKLTPLDNDRYPGLTWTSVRDHLASLERDRNDHHERTKR